MLTGQNGILNRAAEAKEKAETAGIDEQRKLAQAEALMSTGKTTYKGLTLPEGFAPTKIAGEDSIDDGLVITDGNGNEYVWVEVPKTATVYKTAGLNIINFTTEEYQKIEEDLKEYTKEYRDENYDDIYVEDSNIGWFDSIEKYSEAKNKMLKSVYQRGGFYIARYEAGTENNRTSLDDEITVPVSKPDMYPYTYISRNKAKELADKVKTGDYTSSLMFGIQWDLVLKYIEEKKSDIDPKISTKLKSDGKTIGNYASASFELKRGKYAERNSVLEWFDYKSNGKRNLVKNCIKQSYETYEGGILLTTGATETAKLQNIYDLAGNVWEWTLEKNSSYDVFPCALRGGKFENIGMENSASSHTYNKSTFGNYDVGFRVSIY